MPRHPKKSDVAEADETSVPVAEPQEPIDEVIDKIVAHQEALAEEAHNLRNRSESAVNQPITLDRIHENGYIDGNGQSIPHESSDRVFTRTELAGYDCAMDGGEMHNPLLGTSEATEWATGYDKAISELSARDELLKSRCMRPANLGKEDPAEMFTLFFSDIDLFILAERASLYNKGRPGDDPCYAAFERDGMVVKFVVRR
jgi:hypothetical protein